MMTKDEADDLPLANEDAVCLELAQLSLNTEARLHLAESCFQLFELSNSPGKPSFFSMPVSHDDNF